jgi:hypothetical protein
MDETFADALKAKMQGQEGKPLRAGKNFLMELARQLARFDITLQTDTESRPVLILKNWSQTSVIDPKAIPSIPPALVPSAVSAVV